MNLFTVGVQRASCRRVLFVEGRFSARNETLEGVGARSQDRCDQRHAAGRSERAAVTGRRRSAASAIPSSATARRCSRKAPTSRRPGDWFAPDGVRIRRLQRSASRQQSPVGQRLPDSRNERHSAGNGADAAVHRGRRHADPVESDLHRHRTARISGPTRSSTTTAGGCRTG